MPVGTQTYDWTLDGRFFKDMENPDVRGANVKVNLTVIHRDGVYDLSFTFNGEVTLLCDRCLDDLQFPIDTTYHIIVKYGDDYRDDSDDFIEIPESDNDINVAYMINDSVSLAIPIKHVHPQGKCNRAMSALLRKHRAATPGDEDSELENSLIDEMDTMTDDESSTPTDPRWDKLKDLSTDN